MCRLVRLAIAICLLSIFVSPVPAATSRVVNGIAAIVGDSVITYKDIQLAIQDDLEFLGRRYSGQAFTERAAQLEKDALERMVENRLVLQEFETAGYIVPESYIKDRIEADIKTYGDRLTLTKTLQKQGITFENYRKRIRERTILRLMWNEKVPRDPLISPAKIERYYEENQEKFNLEDQVKLRMIVITNNPAFEPEKIAQELIKKLDEGVPFAELARIYSLDSYASSGGERGWLQKSQLRKELADGAFALEPGQHAIVNTPEAVYLIQVEEKKVSYTQTLGEVRDEIEKILKEEEEKRLRTQWVNQLKDKFFVQYF